MPQSDPRFALRGDVTVLSQATEIGYKKAPMFKIVAAFGTRAEAIKFAPLIRAMRARKDLFDVMVVVTGAHRNSLDQVLELFEIKPNVDLNLTEYQNDLASFFSHASAGLSEAFSILEPDLVIVLGDTVTTLAATLVAYYRQIPVAHVEAGLRVDHKFTTFPEEGHRLMVSSVADLHFAHTETAKANLLAQGVSESDVAVTGNPGIDAVMWARDYLERMRKSRELSLKTLFLKKETDPDLRISARALRAMREVEQGKKRLVLFTGSRPENFGSSLQSICGALVRLSDEFPEVQFVYPVDLPNGIRRRVHSLLEESENIHLLPPLNYVPFVFLMQLSQFVLTDSGTIQEEAPGLDKPVLVMRRMTDRPEAVEAGTVQLVGTDAVTIVTAARRLLKDEVHYRRMADAPNPYGEGHASELIVAELVRYAEARDPLLRKAT